MKKAILILLIFALCVSAAACVSNYTVMGCVTKETGSSFSADYALFRGTKTYTVRVKNAPVILVADITTESGELDVSVAKKGGPAIYSQTNITTSRLTVPLNEAGVYSVVLTARSHKGSYRFDWGTDAQQTLRK